MISKKIFFQEKGFEELKKDYNLVDMHVHSKYSHDRTMPIANILKKASKLGIGIAMTDHVRVEGAIRAAKQKKVLVIPGIEINSYENKEILLYFYSPKELSEFYEKYIKNKVMIKKNDKKGITKRFKIVIVNSKMRDIIERANEYNCVKSIPHPYTIPPRRSHRFFSSKSKRDLMKRIDAIEILNSSMTKHMNNLALNWAIKEKKGVTGGSDARKIDEIGATVVASKADTVADILDSIRKKNNMIIGQELRFSKVIKGFLKSQKYKSRYKKELFGE